MDIIVFYINNIKFNVQKGKLITYSGLFKKLLSENTSNCFNFCIPCSMKESEIHELDDASLFLFDMIKKIPCANTLDQCDENNNSMIDQRTDFQTTNLMLDQTTEFKESIEFNEFVKYNDFSKISIQFCYSLYKLSHYFVVNKMKQYVIKFITDHYVKTLLEKEQEAQEKKIFKEIVMNMAPQFAIDPFYLVTYIPQIGPFGNPNFSHLLLKNIKLINKKTCNLLGPRNRLVFEYNKSENMIADYYMRQLCDSFENIVGSKNPRGLLRHRHDIPYNGKLYFYRPEDQDCTFDETSHVISVGAVNTPDDIFTKLNKNERYNIYFRVEAYMNSFEYGFTLAVTQVNDSMTVYCC